MHISTSTSVLTSNMNAIGYSCTNSTCNNNIVVDASTPCINSGNVRSSCTFSTSSLAPSHVQRGTRIIFQVDRISIPLNHDGTVKYGNQVNCYLENLPRFSPISNDFLFYVFYSQDVATQQYEELFRFNCNFVPNLNMKEIYIASHHAMKIITGQSRVIMVNGSHNQAPEQAIAFSATIAHK